MGNSVTDGVVQGVFGEGFTLEAVVAIAVYQGLAMRTMGGADVGPKRGRRSFLARPREKVLLGSRVLVAIRR